MRRSRYPIVGALPAPCALLLLLRTAPRLRLLLPPALRRRVGVGPRRDGVHERGQPPHVGHRGGQCGPAPQPAPIPYVVVVVFLLIVDKAILRACVGVTQQCGAMLSRCRCRCRCKEQRASHAAARELNGATEQRRGVGGGRWVGVVGAGVLGTRTRHLGPAPHLGIVARVVGVVRGT